MSKAFSLAGIRIGWIVSRSSTLLDSIVSARDYTTITVSQLDDQVASYALSRAVLPALIKRNLTLAKTNLEILSSFVDKYSGVLSWVKPTAGTTAFIQFSSKAKPVDDVELAKALAGYKAMVVPGNLCFGLGVDFPGYLRVGYVGDTDVLRAGLEKVGQYNEEHLL
jgi:aspartate/methionine/tyrosine aminotransferase